ALGDGEHGAGAVRSGAEGPELVARRAVEADVEDAVDRARLLLAVSGDEPPLRRDQEPGHRPAGLRLGTRRLDRLAERGGDREPVQVDAERGLAELGVVAPAEPRRK